MDENRTRRRLEQQEYWKEKRQRVINNKRLHLLSEEDTGLLTLEEFQKLVVQLKNSPKNVEKLKLLRNSLVQGEEFIAAFLKTPGVLQKVIGLLIGNHAQLQLEAAAFITNLGIGSHKPTFKVLKTAGPYLITFLHGNNSLLKAQSAWALGNFAADCDVCRSLLEQQGFLPAITELLKSPYNEVVESSLFALQVYTKSSDVNIQTLVSLGILPDLNSILSREPITTVILSDVARVLFNIYSRPGPWESLEVTLTIADNLFGILCQSEPEEDLQVMLVTPVLRCLASIAVADSNLRREISNGTGFPELVKVLMKSKYLHLRKETLWLLHNFAVLNLLPNNSFLEDIIDNIIPLLTPGSSDVLHVIIFLKTLLLEVPRFRTSFSAHSGIMNEVKFWCDQDKDTCHIAQELLTLVSQNSELMEG